MFRYYNDVMMMSLLVQLTDSLHYLLGNHASKWVCMIDKMWSELTIQEYWKDSCDPNLIFTALSSLDYDGLKVSVCLSVCVCVCACACVRVCVCVNILWDHLS